MGLVCRGKLVVSRFTISPPLYLGISSNQVCFRLRVAYLLSHLSSCATVFWRAGCVGIVFFLVPA